MLGSTKLTQILGSTTDNTNHDAMRALIKSACEAGLSLVLITPGTKAPFDGRTPRAKNAADKAAQAEAKEAGRRDWAKAKSPSGLALATRDPKQFLKKNGYLDEYVKVFGDDCAINLAIEVGDSGMIVVDCDTNEQVRKFLEVATGDPETPLSPTVVTPGSQKDGEWIHSDGGHYYFTLTDEQVVSLRRNMGSLTWGGSDGFAVLWERRYVLIPPSTRAEGQYELVGKDYPAPEWLIEAINERAAAKADRKFDNNAEPEDDLGKSINEWADGVTWASILEPLGWTPTARPDNCGCDVWTAPGDHSSPKSATTHDAGCGLNRYTETNAPMKIWTDSPGEPFETYTQQTGSTTMSKLQVVTYSDYDGDIGKAMDALDLGSVDDVEHSLGLHNDAIDQEVAGHDPTEQIVLPIGASEDAAMAAHDDSVRDPESGFDQPLVVTEGTDPIADAVDELDTPPVNEDQDEADEPFPGDDGAPEPDIFETGSSELPIIAPFSHWRDMPPPEYVIDGLIEHGGLSCMIGAPGIGKSGVALDMALCIATGRPWQGHKTLRTRVLYLPGEGLSGSIQRIKAWSHEHDIPHEVIDQGLRLGNDIIRIGASSDSWGQLASYCLRQRIGLIVFDTFARMATGIEENSATDVGRAVVRLDQMRKLTSAGVMLIHHTPKNNPMSGRGSSALNGALDSELCILESSHEYEEQIAGKPIELITTKQKNAEQLDEPIQLRMMNCPEYSAPYITHGGGSIDPMIGDIEMARPRPEPVMETAVRIRRYLDQFDVLGMTLAQIVQGVRMDAYTKTRIDATKSWKQSVLLAVDAGMHYDLLGNAEGSSAKYVSGDLGIEAARRRHAAEVITTIPDARTD